MKQVKMAVLPKSPAGGGFEMGVLLAHKAKAVSLEIMVIDRTVGIELGQDPFKEIVVV